MPINRFIEDDDPPAIGADPDRVRDEPTAKKEPTTLLLDHFESEWERARQADPDLARRAPMRVYPRGKKPAILSWIKKEFLRDYELEHAKAIVTWFIDQLLDGRRGWAYAPADAGSTWSIWGHLSARIDRTVADMETSGWETEAARVARLHAEDERRETSYTERLSQREQLAAFRATAASWDAERAQRPMLVRTHEWPEYDWTIDIPLAESLDGGTYVWDALPPQRRESYVRWLDDHPDEASAYPDWLLRRVGVSVPTSRGVTK